MASKQKTHKATSKVLTKRPGGTIKFKHGNGNHLTAKANGKTIRQRRKSGSMSKGVSNRLKAVI